MILTKKRGVCLILLLCTVLITFGGYSKKADAATTYHNTAGASINGYITSTGVMRTELTVDGIKNVTTRIQADVYIEKRILGIFWKRVDIGYPNNVWHDSTTSFYYFNYFDVQLSSAGTYRATVTYTVSGTGGSDDIITMTHTSTY